jgi:hypothetical protein
MPLCSFYVDASPETYAMREIKAEIEEVAKLIRHVEGN